MPAIIIHDGCFHRRKNDGWHPLIRSMNMRMIVAALAAVCFVLMFSETASAQNRCDRAVAAWNDPGEKHRGQCQCSPDCQCCSGCKAQAVKSQPMPTPAKEVAQAAEKKEAPAATMQVVRYRDRRGRIIEESWPSGASWPAASYQSSCSSGRCGR